MVVNYADGKIYKIVDNTNSNIYVGSTCQKLYTRKAQHERNFKLYLKGKGQYVSSYEILQNGDYNCILIENYPCADKSQLHAREGHWIKQENCVNKRIAGRTENDRIEYLKSYRENNKEAKNNYLKQYYIENKDLMKKKTHDHYLKNKETKLKNGKEYYQYHGKDLLFVPTREIDKPNENYIDWHNTNIYRG